VFNKRTPCIEESVHVLFDETNSLVENNAQDKDFNLGLARKDNGKMLESEPLPKANGKESGQEVDQSGGSSADPDMDRNQPTQPQLSQIDQGTDFRPDPEPGSTSHQERVKSGSMDPFTLRHWKHQSSHPLDQIIPDINSGVQTRSKLRSFALSMLFYLTLSLRMFMNLLQILIVL